MRQYYVLKSGPTKDRIKEVIEHNKKARQKISDYVKGKGFNRFFTSSGFSGIYIPSGEVQPEGWRVPNKNRCSFPKVRSKDYKEVINLPDIIEGFTAADHPILKQFCGQERMTLHFPSFKAVDNVVLLSFWSKEDPVWESDDVVEEKTEREITKLWNKE